MRLSKSTLNLAPMTPTLSPQERGEGEESVAPCTIACAKAQPRLRVIRRSKRVVRRRKVRHTSIGRPEAAFKDRHSVGSAAWSLVALGLSHMARRSLLPRPALAGRGAG